ncbi:MAG TPA: hypothetical protein VGB07_34430 [Blastocatellia bacterium]
MKKTMFLTMMFGLMIALTGSASAQNKGNGRVLTVNDDNVPKSTEFSVKNGNEIVASIATSNGNYGIPKGATFSRIEVRQPNKIIYLYYAADTPELQDIINNKRSGRTTKVNGVCTNSKPLKANDKFTIQSQPAKGGGTDVTFTFGGACFSFIAK